MVKPGERARKLLIKSILSILLGIITLASSTFSWFTDAATVEGGNIQAGTLQINVYGYDLDPSGSNTITIGDDGYTFNMADRTDIGRGGDKYINDTNWSPGTSAVKLIEIRNDSEREVAVKACIDITDKGLAEVIWYDLIPADSTRAIEPKVLKARNNIESAEPFVIDQNDAKQYVLFYGICPGAGNTYKLKSVSADLKVVATQNNDSAKNAVFNTPTP